MDPKVAAEWASELVRRVNEKMRQLAIQDAEKSLEYLVKEVSKTSSVEVREAIYRIMESQIKQIMLANVRDEYSFKIIDPPAVPDLDDEVKPKKKLIVILGFVLGGFGGVFIAFFRNYIQNVKAREKQD
jgi:LPS O-antigen subunit length determinant protein (WzzB/FepE family)